VVECPFCALEANLQQSRSARDPWRFRLYEVRMLERCGGAFNYYRGVAQGAVGS